MLGEEPFDVVIAADLIYSCELHPALLQTLKAVLTPDITTLLLAYERRGTEVESFLASAERLFGSTLVHADEIVGPDERGVEIMSLRLVNKGGDGGTDDTRQYTQ